MMVLYRETIMSGKQGYRGGGGRGVVVGIATPPEFWIDLTI